MQSNEACYGEFIILPEAGLAFSYHRPDNITTIQYATADFDKKRRNGANISQFISKIVTIKIITVLQLQHYNIQIKVIVIRKWR